MTITITSTSKVVKLNGIDCRVWEGVTVPSGIKIHCFIPLLAVKKDEDCSQFEAELKECEPPSAEIDGVYPLRMIL